VNNFKVFYDGFFDTLQFFHLAFASWGPLSTPDGLQEDLPDPVVLCVIFLSLLFAFIEESANNQFIFQSMS